MRPRPSELGKTKGVVSGEGVVGDGGGGDGAGNHPEGCVSATAFIGLLARRTSHPAHRRGVKRRLTVIFLLNACFFGLQML